MVARRLTLLALLALGGCTSTGTLCAVGPFQPDPGFETRLTRGEKEQIYTLNRSGEDVCDWKEP